MKKEDPLNIFLDDGARFVLFSLVDNLEPHRVTQDDNNDLFNPTISAIFKLFNELMMLNTPDLYLSEWQCLSEAVEHASRSTPYHRLLSDTSILKRKLVMVLEDIGDSSNEEISTFELSKKIAGFCPTTTTAIAYHIQRSLIAKRRGQNYIYPEIEFKG